MQPNDKSTSLPCVGNLFYEKGVFENVTILFHAFFKHKLGNILPVICFASNENTFDLKEKNPLNVS